MLNYKYWIECSGKIEKLCLQFGGTPMDINEVSGLFGPETIICTSEELNDGFHYTRGIPNPADPDEKCVYIFQTKEAYYKILDELHKIYMHAIDTLKSVNEYTLTDSVNKRPIVINQAVCVYDIFYELYYTDGLREISMELYELLRWSGFIIQNSKGLYKTGLEDSPFELLTIFTPLEFHEC